jgi:hypothetical protein
MGERSAEVEARLGPPDLAARLERYPELRAKIEALLGLIEGAHGDVEKAAVAEQQVVEAMRAFGHDVLQRWADRQQQRQAAAGAARPGVNRKKKKRSPGTRASAKSR